MTQHALLLHSFNLGALMVVFFIVGMIKPKWALFFMQKPTRWIVTMATTVMFMIVMTMHAEGSRQVKVIAKHQKPAAATATSVPALDPESVPVPVPEQTPAKETPKQASKSK